MCDLHANNKLQAPGGAEQTKLALQFALAGSDDKVNDNAKKDKIKLSIADFGCGTGASALVLASELGPDVRIAALDLLPEFLEKLRERAKENNTLAQIDIVEGSFESLPFADASFDVIWSEGAIYNIGFERGLREWRRFLRPNGILAVSEITWLTPSRPTELTEYWMKSYSEIDTAANKIAILARAGYSLIGFFVLPKHCWDEYYAQVQSGCEQFLQKHAGSALEAAARDIVREHEEEHALFEKYHSYYSYAFYVMKKQPQ